MRVATRRLRAVLEIYEPCFPRKELRGVLRDVKALADALGERRDPDVAARGADAPSQAAVPKVDGPGVELFAQLVRAEQEAGNATLAAGAAGGRGHRPARAPAGARRVRPGGRPREGPQRQGPGSRRPAGRQPRADRPRAPRRAVRLRARGSSTPRRSSRCTTCGSPPSACATSSRSARSRASGPTRSRRASAPRSCRTCWARSTTATCTLPRVLAMIDGLRAADAREAVARAGDADDLDPAHVARRRATRPRGAASRRSRCTWPPAGRCSSSASWRSGGDWSARASGRAWSTRSASAHRWSRASRGP